MGQPQSQASPDPDHNGYSEFHRRAYLYRRDGANARLFPILMAGSAHRCELCPSERRRVFFNCVLGAKFITDTRFAYSLLATIPVSR